MKRFFCFPLFGVLLLAACGGSAPLSIREAWARPAESGQNSAIYFTIENPGPEDVLLGVSSEAAEAVEMHRSMMNDTGAMTMQQQTEVRIPARDALEFKPGGYHVMLINLKQPLAAGDTFRAVLHFQNAGDISVEVTVQQP